MPATAGAAAYKHYVACGISRNATPSHVCPKGSKKGAFFKSLNADVVYRGLAPAYDSPGALPLFTLMAEIAAARP